MSYNYQRDETVFGCWLKKIVGDALKEGIVDIHDIKDLYDEVSKVSYANGYKHGKNDGYLEAVAKPAAGYDLSEYKD